MAGLCKQMLQTLYIASPPFMKIGINIGILLSILEKIGIGIGMLFGFQNRYRYRYG